MDLALNKLQRLVCHKTHQTKPNQTKPEMLELCGMRNSPLLSLLLGPLWLGEVAPDRVPSMDQIELNCVFMLNWIAWKRTVFDTLVFFRSINTFVSMCKSLQENAAYEFFLTS